MMSRKSESQPSLLSRVSSATDLLPHTQSLNSRHGLYNAGTGIVPPGLPAISSRPGSSRPQSRVDARPISSRPMSSRPSSQLEQSRPGSRMMETSRPSSRMLPKQPSAGTVQRPGSSIRPLSSRVFMRRMEHGWVAKHYPDNEPASQTNLNDFEDFSDCESLDSFFDEEFDDREHSEKLGDLLSCNTLGVESRGQKRDWNAGEVGIPKFHCPRCRDHWYGVTPFPCDEELTRLIREGLWYTGKGDGGKINTRTTSGENSGVCGDGGSSSPLNRGGNSSPHKAQRHKNLKAKNGENDPLEMGTNGSKKNKKKRITFKLDIDEQDETGSGLLDEKYDRGSNAALSSAATDLERESYDSDRPRTSDDNTNSSNANAGSSSNLPNGFASSSAARVKDGLSSENSGVLVGSGSNTSLTRRQRRKGKGKSSGGSSTDISKSASEEESRSRGSKQGRGGNRGSVTQLSDEAGMGLANALAGNQDHRKPTSDDGQARNVNDVHDTNINGGTISRSAISSIDDSATCTGQTASDEKQPGHESLQHASQSSITSNQSKKLETGPDYGRKVRKPGGYMRAGSPTGSEWGDPAHARPYASSTTASSRTGSTSNLHKDKSTLPPIIPPIKASRKPTLDFSECGFEITPPWRFSYFSPSPLYSATRPATATTTNTRRRK